jgi:hypothetical protein
MNDHPSPLLITGESIGATDQIRVIDPTDPTGRFGDSNPSPVRDPELQDVPAGYARMAIFTFEGLGSGLMETPSEAGFTSCPSTAWDAAGSLPTGGTLQTRDDGLSRGRIVLSR